MRGVHDLGGQPGEAVQRAEHEPTLFDKRVDALMSLCSHPDLRLIRVDELRRVIESLPKDAYFDLKYYERWMYAIATLLVEKGVLREDEIGERIHELQHRLGMADHQH